MKMTFMFKKASDEKHLMNSKSDNREFMTSFNTGEVVTELFESALHRYQVCLEQSMKGSEFRLSFVDGLFCKCHKISFNRGAS